MSQKIYHRIREVRKREISQVNIDRDKSLFSLVLCPTKKEKGGGNTREAQRESFCMQLPLWLRISRIKVPILVPERGRRKKEMSSINIFSRTL